MSDATTASLVSLRGAGQAGLTEPSTSVQDAPGRPVLVRAGDGDDLPVRGRAAGRVF